MQCFTTWLFVLLSLCARYASAWPFGLYYDDVCDLRARSVWHTPLIEKCLVMTNVMGPSFIAVKGTVGDGLDWDKNYEICLYDKKTDCFRDNSVNCFPVGEGTANCTRLNSGTHVVKFRLIPTNHTNVLISQSGAEQG